ncbi:ras-domain-containing protein [Calocera viscosa TUFC12733]|uniref:Ras-domain-containing protein n=1 Tax=Calocera viscosa (strain TUFC12733) TaxID=1330018 RepID=A0A167RNR7_CALVF|nr:ras-domain-containing protein [Calocera viscosa TUFC12733]
MAASGMEHWKVTMLGDGGVGKTALAVQFTQKQFIETYDPTIEDSYRKQVFVDGKMSFLEIIDTAGQEDYSTLREQWIREGQGFILVYSVTNQTSFQNIDRFRKTMISLHAELPVFLIIGNKADDPYRREVSAEQGLTYARRHNCEFFEASAKTGQNVEKLFGEVVRQLRANARSAPQPLTPNSTTSTNGRGSSRTSASGYTGSGTATPLTVPSSGSLAHTAGRPSRGPFGTMGDSPNAGGNAFSASHAPPGRPGPNVVPGKPGSGSSSSAVGNSYTSAPRGTGTGRGLGSNGRGAGDGAAGYPGRDPRGAGPPGSGGGGGGGAGMSRPQINTGVSGSGSGYGNGSGSAVGSAGAKGKYKPQKKGKDKDKGGCVVM